MKTLSIVGAVLITVASGRASAATNYVLKLGGATDYVQVTDSDSLDLIANFTMEAWINPAKIVNEEQAVISKPRRTAGTGVELRTFGNGVSLTVNNDDGSGPPVNLVFGGGDSLELNTWHHVAVTYDGTVGNVYIDGLRVATNQFSIKLLNSSEPLTIGQKSQPGSPLVQSFLGLVDEVRVWGRALSQEELRLNMWLRLTGNEPDLRGYWHFDAGNANDSSSNGNNGQLMGQAQVVADFEGFPRPVLISSRFSFLRGYRFTLNGEADVPYQIETSNDLAAWSVLATVKFTGSSLEFTDASATNFPSHYFYRVKRLP